MQQIIRTLPLSVLGSKSDEGTFARIASNFRRITIPLYICRDRTTALVIERERDSVGAKNMFLQTSIKEPLHSM